MVSLPVYSFTTFYPIRNIIKNHEYLYICKWDDDLKQGSLE